MTAKDADKRRYLAIADEWDLLSSAMAAAWTGRAEIRTLAARLIEI
ncbi:MAG TPA: hypothetical protein VJL90_02195 [Pseudorhodoplanes sp.]|nr:hypothetical protein [Pseudorhodoplanes sp.]